MPALGRVLFRRLGRPGRTTGRYRTLKEAVDTGRLRPQASARHLAPFIVEPDLPEDAAAMLERTDSGECVFLERGTKLCIVHRDNTN